MILEHRKLQRIRAGYIGAAMGAAGLAWSFLSGRMAELFFSLFKAPRQPPPEWLSILKLAAYPLSAYPLAALILGLGGLFLLLAWRPWWPGKLLCLLCAIAWGLFCTAAVLIGAPAGHPAIVVGGTATGLVLLAGILHQLNDPSFRGSYARA